MTRWLCTTLSQARTRHRARGPEALGDGARDPGFPHGSSQLVKIVHAACDLSALAGPRAVS
jgi:hypothetical protein